MKSKYCPHCFIAINFNTGRTVESMSYKDNIID